ncbi:MAG: hypothetical protein WCI27_06685 [Candidatus Omnitrophota bacterium]
MNFPAVAQVVFGLPVEGPFDYIIPGDMSGKIFPGARVLVRFAGKKRCGVVVRLLQKTAHDGKLSVLIKNLDASPVFSPAFLKLADCFAARFACTSGEALEIFLPAYLRGARLFACEAFDQHWPEDAAGVDLVFDKGQQKRWDIILPRITAVLGEGQGVIVMMPDASRCHDVLPKIGPLLPAPERVLLAGSTPKEEYGRWLAVREGKIRLVAGFISAVFAPVRNLGLIVVLDEENAFYRHEQSPFFHAREAALERAAVEGCAVICVSSAPSVEMWHRVEKKSARLILLEQELPPVKFLDLTNFKMRKGMFISLGLRHHIEAALKEKRQILLYIQAARGVGGVCAEVKKIFPGARVTGYDRASTALAEDFDILVATQSVFRHRAVLKVAVAVVLDIDWEFHKHDIQAAHSAFALVQHLRQMVHAYVLLQTRNAADTFLHTLASADGVDFYRQELLLRSEMGVPPFRAQASIVIRSEDPALACAEAKRLYDMLIHILPDEVTVLDPEEDRSALVRGKFRYCFLVQGAARAPVVAVARQAVRMFRPKKDTVVTVSMD